MISGFSYNFNDYCYQLDFQSNKTGISYNNNDTHSNYYVFLSNSIILISPEDFEKKLSLLTTLQ